MLAAVRNLILVPRTHNLLLQSENIGTTWTNTNSVEDLDAVAAPNGSLTADRLIDDSGTGVGGVGVSQSFTGVAGGLFTYSAHLKADQLAWARLRIAGAGSLVIQAYFDLTSGLVGAAVGANNITQGIIDLGNGWFRGWVAFQGDAADVSWIATVDVAEGNNDATVDRDGTSSIFCLGMQINPGVIPTRYRKTTTAAYPA